MSATVQEWDGDDRIDVRGMIMTLWRRRWWVIGSVVVSTLAFAIAAFTMTPIYRATVVLVAVEAERAGMSGNLNTALGQLGGLASLAGINLNAGGSGKEEALAVLRSREFTEAFINDHGLMPELFAEKWDAERRAWRPDKGEPPTPAKAYQLFDSIRTIVQDRRTGLIIVQIDWKDREKAALWANELVNRINAEMRRRAIATANASVGYLEKEIESTSIVTTREAISRLMEAQIRQRMLANVNHQYSFRIVDKAMAPDVDDRVRPQRLLLLVAGAVIGTVVGVGGVLLFAPAHREGSARAH
jgi:uncharacterized protein involved in exopolysaccharide biosynthesis